MAQELPSSFDRWLRAGTIVMVVLAFGLLYWVWQRRAERAPNTEQLKQRLEMAPMLAKSSAGLPLSLFDRDQLRPLGTLVYATRQAPDFQPQGATLPQAGTKPQDAAERQRRTLERDYRTHLKSWQRQLDDVQVPGDRMITVYAPQPGETVSFLLLGMDERQARPIADRLWNAGVIEAASLYGMQSGEETELRLVNREGIRKVYWGGMELYTGGELTAKRSELEELARRMYFDEGAPPIPEDQGETETTLSSPPEDQ